MHILTFLHNEKTIYLAKLAFEARRKNFTQFVVAPPSPPCNYYSLFFLSKIYLTK
jgi:hypothetical protein